MKKTLLFTLALIAAGCGPAEQSETLSEGSEQVTPSVRGIPCADLSARPPLEDVRTCAEQGYALAQFNLGASCFGGNHSPLGCAHLAIGPRIPEEGKRLVALFLSVELRCHNRLLLISG